MNGSPREVFARDLGILIRCGEREKCVASSTETSGISDLETVDPTSVKQVTLFSSPVGHLEGQPPCENHEQAETVKFPGGFDETENVPPVHMSHLLEDVISVTKGELLILDNCEPSDEIPHEDPELDQEEG